MSIKALEDAIEIAGGQSALGRKIGRDQKAIWAWINTTQKVPAEDVIKIEAAVDGKITRFELRPDIYPRPKPMDRIRIIGGNQFCTFNVGRPRSFSNIERATSGSHVCGVGSSGDTFVFGLPKDDAD